MAVRSPFRTRKIILSAVVGGVVGASLGIFGYLQWHTWMAMIFTVFGALIAAGTAAMSEDEFER